MDENACHKAIKAKEMAAIDGHLLVFDHAVTFERLGLKPFRDEVDGLGPASMAVVRAPGMGEFLATTFDYMQGHPHGGMDVQCQGEPTVAMLDGFLSAAGVPLGEVAWVCPSIEPMPPGFDAGKGTRS